MSLCMHLHVSLYAPTCLTHVQPVSSFLILSLLNYSSEHTKCGLVLGNLSVCSVHLCVESRRTVGVVAECALSVTNDSRREAVMWPATKSHSKWRSLPTIMRPRRRRQTDFVHPSCSPSFCFFIPNCRSILCSRHRNTQIKLLKCTTRENNN